MNSPLRILCLENDLADAQLLLDTLDTEGIACKLTRVETECDFRDALQQGGFDLILADYTLPSFDGMSALRMVRQELPDVPFIFVSGTLGEEVAIEALKTGATDYVFKTRLSRLAPAIDRAMREAEERSERKRAEDEVRATETRFRAFVEHLTDGLFIHDDQDEDGRVIDVNQHACNSLGYTREELIGMTALDFDAHVDATFMRSIKERLAHAEIVSFESVHRRKDGTEFPVEIRSRSFWHGDHRFGLALVRDITERKRAEEALAFSSVALNNVRESAFLVDEKSRFHYVNEEACRSLGYTREELLGMCVRGVDPDFPMERWPDHWAAVKSYASLVFESRHRAKNGRIFPVELNSNYFEYGGKAYILGLARDISERKRAEEAIRQSERQLRDLIEGIPAIAATIRLDGSVEFINQRYREYTGMSAEEALGSGWQSAFHPKDVDHYLEKRRAALASGDPWDNEVRIRSANGDYRWFLFRGVPLRDEQGNIIRWYATAIDIEDRKQVEEVRLEERVRERTRIARDLHDTLLQSFQGLVYRFQAARYQLPDYPKEAADALDRALISADQALAEGRSAIQGLRSEPFQESNLEQLLLATGRELASSQNGGGNAPPLRVIVEGTRRAKRAVMKEEIYRIARELLRNAYRHAHARSIEAELRYNEDAFLLIVRDDGRGIDPKILKNRGRAGHWGLPGMYERAEGMGSRLDIWSEAGAGTEVRLTVPGAIAYENPQDGGRFKLFRKARVL